MCYQIQTWQDMYIFFILNILYLINAQKEVQKIYADETFCTMLFFFPWRNNHYWARVSSLLRLHDHTQTHHTRYDSSRRVVNPTQRPLPNNTDHSQESSLRHTGFELAIPVSEGPQTHAWDCAATGSGFGQCTPVKPNICSSLCTSYCSWSGRDMR
jgi:hypothetical protein